MTSSSRKRPIEDAYTGIKEMTTSRLEKHKSKLSKLEKQLAVTWATVLGQQLGLPAEAVTWQSESLEWDRVAFFKIDNEKILAAKVLQNFTTKFKEKLEKKAEDPNAKMKTQPRVR